MSELVGSAADPHAFIALDGTEGGRADAAAELLISPTKKSRPINKLWRTTAPNSRYSARPAYSYQPPKTPVVHSFGLPEACKKYSDLCEPTIQQFLSSVNSEDDLASRNEAKVPAARGGMKLDLGAALHPEAGYAIVALPQFTEKQHVSLEVREHSKSHLIRVQWHPTSALYLNGSGLFVVQGVVRFVCLLYPTISAEEPTVAGPS